MEPRKTPRDKGLKLGDETFTPADVESPVVSPRKQRKRSLEKELASRGDTVWLQLLDFDPMEDFSKASKAIEQRRRVASRARSTRRLSAVGTLESPSHEAPSPSESVEAASGQQQCVRRSSCLVSMRRRAFAASAFLDACASASPQQRTARALRNLQSDSAQSTPSREARGSLELGDGKAPLAEDPHPADGAPAGASARRPSRRCSMSRRSRRTFNYFELIELEEARA